MDLRFWRSKTNSAVKNVINQAMKKDVVFIDIYIHIILRERVYSVVYILFINYLYLKFTQRLDSPQIKWELVSWT